MVTWTVRITVVVDNKQGLGLSSEHGLSLWIETVERPILLDTGQGEAFVANLRSLGVDLSRTDVLVLSHGHYDHTGGLAHCLGQADQAVVYCHPAVTRARYTIREGKATAIGMPETARVALQQLPAGRVQWVEGPCSLAETVHLTGPIPRRTSYEDTGGPFYLDPRGEQPDLLEDDLALWVQTKRGLVACLGCCHAGLVNTLEYISELSGRAKVRAVIGGLHLVNASAERLARTLAYLEGQGPELIVPLHCSGEAAVEALGQAFGERVVVGRAGATFEL